MVEPNSCWDSIVNGVNAQEFASILSILDFPMESLEGDGGDEDLDASSFENLGPVPMDSLRGVPPVSQTQVAGGSEIKGPSPNAPINIKSELIEPANCVGYNGANIPSEGFIPPEFTVRTPSPDSVLESTVSCSFGKCLTTKPEIAILGRARSKRKRPSNLHPWFRTSVVVCSASVENISSNSGNNNDSYEQMSESSNDFVDIVNPSRQARKKPQEEFLATRKKENTLHMQSASTNRCTHCQTRKTPQWREGPLGRRTLCNACGVRYRSGRLFPEYRPASSPTFVQSIHSNSHREVIKMRNRAT